MKKKKFKVVYFKPESKSFKYSTGYYFILKDDGVEVKLAKIKEGVADRYDDDTLNVVITGKGNEGIIKTGMTIKVKVA